MIKMSKEEFDRLMETSPNVPEKIVLNFKTNFIEQKMFEKIAKPEICDILIPTDDYRNQWYSEENQTKAITEQIKSKLEKQNKIKKIDELNNKIVKDFVELFINLNKLSKRLARINHLLF